MPEIESAVVRVVVDVSKQLSQLSDHLLSPSPKFPTKEIEKLLAALGSEAVTLLGYLDSPDFAAVVTQLRFDRHLGQVAQDQLYQGLRLAGLTDRLLDRTAELLHRVVVAACDEMCGPASWHSQVSNKDIVRAGADTSRMLARLRSLAGFHTFIAHMRGQVAKLHNSIRLPHIGVSRAVPYDQLYVRADLDPAEPRLGVPGDRTVILGDPGAGKSTLAARFAHHVATDDTGRVPFLVVLREFTGTFAQGGHDLLHYLEAVCRAPYNVQPPDDGVEYLLRTGRAVVVLDGLDELVQTEMRRRTVALVEAFAHMYPLVPILVTAREIGYGDAPLDQELFARSKIRDFERHQVQEYVRRWFALDDATSPADKERLAAAFLRDSEPIPELRSNPLMLALLCAMYSSDRYLPRNLAQVYERCALMLFEQWDAKRGIELPLNFHGRLRGAVQFLAWRMFTAPESGKAQSRTRIVRMLTEYLEHKLDDHDEARAAAEHFLTYCTGRSWILTDVGATETEPQYGFTHRTFMEYFAAEYLVRTHRTAEALWATLRPNIAQWDVVAQIAVQLHDRNNEGGADELLAVALDNSGVDFAARSLHYLMPSNRTIRAITAAAVDRSAAVSVEQRLAPPENTSITTDNALLACMRDSLPANRAIIEQTVADRLTTLVYEGVPGAVLVLDLGLIRLHTGDMRWEEIREALLTEHHNAIVALRGTVPWGGGFAFAETGFLVRLVEDFGVWALYTTCSFIGRYTDSAAMLAHAGTMLQTDADVLAVTIAAQPVPWRSTFAIRLDKAAVGEHSDSLRVLLALPNLELTGRPSRAIALTRVDQTLFPPQVREFLGRWERGEINVLAHGPKRQLLLPEQR